MSIDSKLKKELDSIDLAREFSFSDSIYIDWFEKGFSYEDFQAVLENNRTLKDYSLAHEVVISLQENFFGKSQRFQGSETDFLKNHSEFELESIEIGIHSKYDFLGNLIEHDRTYLGYSPDNKWIVLTGHVPFSEWEGAPTFWYSHIRYVLKTDFTERVMRMFEIGETTEI